MLRSLQKMILKNNHIKISDKSLSDDPLFLIYRGGYVSGFEIILKRNGDDKKSLDHNIMRSFVDVVRDKIPRSASVYIVTLVRKYYGGTYVLCLDKNERADKICELFAATLETLGKGFIKTKRLKKGDIKELIFLKNIQNEEFPDIHELYAETIDINYVNYSIKEPLNIDGILIGETSRTRIKSVYKLPMKDLVRHIAIFGSTGSGKTTSAATIAFRAFKKGAKTIILDWHGEYRNIIKERSVEEIVIESLSSLEKLPVFKNPMSLSEIFETVLELSPAQSYILSKALNRLRDKEISFKRIYEEVSLLPEEARWVPEAKLSLMRKIEPMLDLEKDDELDLSKTLDLEKKNRFIIINLSYIERSSIRSLATLLIVKSLALYKQKNLNSNENNIDLVVIDEAHHVFRRSEGSEVMRDLLAEIRKYGVGMILVTQSPSSIGEDVMKNTNTKIIHSIKSDVDRRILKESIIMSREIEELIPLLEVGEAVISTPSHPYPLVIRIIPSTEKENIDL